MAAEIDQLTQLKMKFTEKQLELSVAHAQVIQIEKELYFILTEINKALDAKNKQP